MTDLTATPVAALRPQVELASLRRRLASMLYECLPAFGVIVVGGLAPQTALGLAFGAGLGTTVAAFVDLATAARHDELFQRELDAGRWILVVGGTEEQLRRAEIVVSTHDVLHVDRV